MLHDHFVAAFRSLRNSRFYAAINIAGLATGFAVAILLTLYVQDELTYDHIFPAETYRISSAITMPGGQAVTFDGTDYALAEGMKRDLPQIQATARMVAQDWTLRRGTFDANETVYWADSALFSVLPMKAIAGDPERALVEPNSIVLTRFMARKYFGEDAPLGKTLQLNGAHDMRVTAVVEDLPSNTHLGARIFGSGNTPFSSLAEMDARNDAFHFDGSAYTYFRLKAGASVDGVRAALPDLVVRRLHIPKKNAFGVAVTLSVMRLRDIRFAPGGVNAMKPPGDAAAVLAAAIMALLILIGACVNFINLATARVGRRAREVGVRKLVGASRTALATQFIAEAMMQVGVGMLLALAAVELLLPLYNGFLQREIVISYWRPEVTGMLLLAVVAVGLLAGAYPALVLSSLRPAVAIRGGPAFLGEGRLRRILVLVQFAILTGLVIATVVMWRQTAFAAESARQLSDRNMVLISAPCTDGLRNGLAGLPGVTDVACSQPTMITSDRGYVEMMETSPTDIHSFRTLSVDPGFLESYGLKPIAGRLFDRAQGGDRVAPPDGATPQEIRLVINRTALRDLGLRDPRAALGMRLQASLPRGQRFYTIIGVVPDFATDSVRVPVAPTAYLADPARFGMISARVSPGHMAEVTAAMRNLWVAAGQPGLPKILALELYAAGLYRDIDRDRTLFAATAAVALFIACIGLFGMASFIAEQRTKEIGIRKVMGATTGQLASLLLWHFLKPVLWANVIAWPIVWWLMRRWLDGFAYHVPLDLWPFLVGGVFTLVVTLGTVAAQAILVARQPPVMALRYE